MKKIINFINIGLISFLFVLGCEKPADKAAADKAVADKVAADKAAADKAAADKAAADKVISEVMNFLKTQNFNIRTKNKKEKDSYKTSEERENYTYFFDYEPMSKCLIVDSRNDKSRFFQLGLDFRSSSFITRESVKIHLESCNPSISLLGDSTFKEVRISGNMQNKRIFHDSSREGSGTNDVSDVYGEFLSPTLPAEKNNKFSEIEYSESHQSTISFYVHPDLAPRLKVALEDLLRAHGVNPSKY
jgi:hypothetical protein